MQVEQVQRWVITALVSTMALVWIGCQLGYAVWGMEPDKQGGAVMLLVICCFIALATIVGIRLVHEKSWKTPWLVAAVLPLAIGLWLM